MVSLSLKYFSIKKGFYHSLGELFVGFSCHEDFFGKY